MLLCLYCYSRWYHIYTHDHQTLIENITQAYTEVSKVAVSQKGFEFEISKLNYHESKNATT